VRGGSAHVGHAGVKTWHANVAIMAVASYCGAQREARI
jgi:hypothetical protein